MRQTFVKQLKITSLVLVVLSLFAAAVSAQSVSSAGPSPVTSGALPTPTDSDILSVQVQLYAMMINKLKADMAKREQEWAEYSKSLWQPNPTLGTR